MIDAKMVMQLRGQTGAGVNDARKALEEADGDLTKATEILRTSGTIKADKKTERTTGEGVIHAYTHGSKLGVLVELLCETDFVARTPEFQELAHDIAMQIAATNPLYVKPEDIPAEVTEKEQSMYKEEATGKPENVIEKIIQGKMDKWFSEICLMKQPFIKDEDTVIETLIKNKIAKIGENIQVRRFVRFNLSEK